jgi:hypothetical protein
VGLCRGRGECPAGFLGAELDDPHLETLPMAIDDFAEKGAIFASMNTVAMLNSNVFSWK